MAARYILPFIEAEHTKQGFQRSFMEKFMPLGQHTHTQYGVGLQPQQPIFPCIVFGEIFPSSKQLCSVSQVPTTTQVGCLTLLMLLRQKNNNTLKDYKNGAFYKSYATGLDWSAPTFYDGITYYLTI